MLNYLVNPYYYMWQGKTFPQIIQEVRENYDFYNSILIHADKYDSV